MNNKHTNNFFPEGEESWCCVCVCAKTSNIFSGHFPVGVGYGCALSYRLSTVFPKNSSLPNLPFLVFRSSVARQEFYQIPGAVRHLAAVFRCCRWSQEFPEIPNQPQLLAIPLRRPTASFAFSFLVSHPSSVLFTRRNCSFSKSK